MLCPACGFEVDERSDRCPQCSAVVDAAPDPDRELVPVLRTTDGAMLSVIRSMLEAAGIPCIVHGEGGMNMFPVGPAGTRVTQRSLGASLLVSADRAEEARALIETPLEQDE